MTAMMPVSKLLALRMPMQMSMKLPMNISMGLPIRLLLGLLFIQSFTVAAMPIEQQRKVYLEARQALTAGHIKQFKRLAGSIQDYPLYPYLLHDYMRPRLWKMADDDIIRFLKRYDDLPMAARVRRAWLRVLAKRGRWSAYLDNYTPQTDISLQCYQLQARIKTGREAYLLEDARTIWLVGVSQPPQCDAAFAKLYHSELMTDELIWQRITLAMDKGNIALAGFLSRKLPEQQQRWMQRWISVHHNPDKGMRNIRYQDTPVSRAILVHGMRRLTQISIDKAIARWAAIKDQYAFSREQINAVEKVLALRATARHHPAAIRLLDQLDKRLIDADLFQWRLRAALQQEDWLMLKNWTSGAAPNDEINTRWLFWHARALQIMGDEPQARKIFAKIARERDYYGFRAADRLQSRYHLNHHPLPEDLEAWHQVMQRPALIRAHELYLLGQNSSARREWQHDLKSMTTYQMQIAANIAASWGWHDRAILTLGKAKAYDDLVLRFPLPYQGRIQQYAEKRALDLAWMYALVRAESAFIEKVRSPAGALGLMQVMPETGKETAKSIGYQQFHTTMLLDEEHNVAIGSAYLQHMFKHFQQNYVLATAAYNAGPGNVARWLPKHQCEDPEIWIEKIPFSETRKYVRRILYYASIYDWRLRQQIIPLGQRMQHSIPTKKQLVAKLACSRPADHTVASITP